MYSEQWFQLFSRTITPEQTEREVGFIARQLPRATHPKLLDLCCGEGRHATRLAALGYDVTGVDQVAPPSHAAFNFIRRDMRDIKGLGPFDGVISMWQSFGYFSDAENRQLLRSVATLLDPRGRLLLDVYNREFFEQNQGVREFVRAGMTVTETKHIINSRLSVRLDYGGGGATDTFEWHVYTPAEICGAAQDAGLRPLLSCTSFDEAAKPSPAEPRMQLVFQHD